MVDTKMTMDTIEKKVYEKFQSDLHCIHADDNSEELVFLIRIRNVFFFSKQTKEKKRSLDQI